MQHVRRRPRPPQLFVSPSGVPLLAHCPNRLPCRCVNSKSLRSARTPRMAVPPVVRPGLQAFADNPSSKRAPERSAETAPSPLHHRDASAEARGLLEWDVLSERVADLARTSGGRAFLLRGDDGLSFPATREGSELLLEQTREAYALEHRLRMPLPLSGVFDVTEATGASVKGIALSGVQLREIAATLAAGRRIRRHVDAAHDADGAFPRLVELARAARTWPDVERVIVEKIDEFGEVSDSADPALAGIRMEKRDVTASIRERLGSIMARHADAIQERVITTRYDRFVILVKMAKKSVFKSGTVHDVSGTGGTAYIEPAGVRGLNDKLRGVCSKEKARVHAILLELSEKQVAPIADDISILSEALAAIDAACARAQAAYDLDAVDVQFSNADGDPNPLQLRGLRHPLLSWAALSDASPGAGKLDWKADVVPSDYLIPAEVRCVCITGPNTGGKTVALKTIGLAALMAKAGLFLLADRPTSGDADAVRIPYFDNVLVDIGDDQSLVQSLSTFSGHVQRIKRILSATTPQSLVLFDEIGSGTDPAEGAALGAAILRSLAVEKHALLTMATTHHGELKTLKYAGDGTGHLFENASVEFDDVAMKPTFRLLWGIPGRSNALAIAKRLGLADDIIEDARSLLIGANGAVGGAAGKVDFEGMIADLEQERRAAEEASGHARTAREEAKALRNEADKRLQKLAAAETGLRQDQRLAVDEEIANAKKSIADVIRKMQRAGPSAQAAAKASVRLSQIEGRLRHGSAAPPSEELARASGPLVFVVGDSVRVSRLGPGFSEVVEVAGNGDAVIAVGSMRAKVKRKEIVEVRKKVKQAQIFGRKSNKEAAKKAVSVRTAANTVDIRGERVDEAEVNVEQAMVKAISMGVLWVIHGHGTGKLRAGIREFLRRHDLVASFKDAEKHDGGTGVTIVTLK